jgi:hypothetical protein
MAIIDIAFIQNKYGNFKEENYERRKVSQGSQLSDAPHDVAGG